MKQAILVVAFGSTVDSARKHNIDSVVEHIRKSYPDYTVELAFSSRMCSHFISPVVKSSIN